MSAPPGMKVRAEINRTLACFCSEQVSPDPGKEVWEEWRREAEIRRQGCQTSTECIPKPLRPASQTSRSGLGPREIAGRAWSPACGLQGSPSHAASRALPERVEFTRDSGRPAGRRADRQTPRCRAVSGCARVRESKEGRANSSYPLTLLCRPALL